MGKKVTVTFSFVIPAEEIIDVDMAALKIFIKEQLGILDEIGRNNSNQFTYYELSNFSPKIIEQRFENV